MCTAAVPAETEPCILLLPLARRYRAATHPCRSTAPCPSTSRCGCVTRQTFTASSSRTEPQSPRPSSAAHRRPHHLCRPRPPRSPLPRASVSAASATAATPGAASVMAVTPASVTTPALAPMASAPAPRPCMAAPPPRAAATTHLPALRLPRPAVPHPASHLGALRSAACCCRGSPAGSGPS